MVDLSAFVLVTIARFDYGHKRDVDDGDDDFDAVVGAGAGAGADACHGGDHY